MQQAPQQSVNRHRLGYTEYRFWSPMLGCDAVRLSMYDDHGGEFFMILKDEQWRETRERGVRLIRQAIDAGLRPGEVRVRA